MVITGPLSRRQAGTMACKIMCRRSCRYIPPIRRLPMTERHGWKPVSLAEDDEDGDDGDEDDDE